MGGVACALAGSGVTTTNSFVVTTGNTTDSGTVAYNGFVNTAVETAALASVGSCSPPLLGITAIGGAMLSDADYNIDSFLSIDNVVVSVFGNAVGVAWTSVTINGTVFTRASATVPNGTLSGSHTVWSWIFPVGNPFGTLSGATKTVVFA